MNTGTHVLRPPWETVDPEEIYLTVSIDGHPPIRNASIVIPEIQRSEAKLSVEVGGDTAVSHAVVRFSQSEYWGTARIALDKTGLRTFEGSLVLPADVQSKKESYQLEVLLYGDDPSEARPIGRGGKVSISRSKADKPDTNWSELHQVYVEFDGHKNMRLNRAKKHLWRLLFENGRVTIYLNLSGIRKDHCDLLKIQPPDQTQAAIRVLLISTIAKSAMTVQQSWELLQLAENMDSASLADATVIRAYGLGSKMTGGPVDPEDLGNLLCDIEYEGRAKQKALNVWFDRALEKLAEVKKLVGVG
jgi:hypothetical protein